MAVTTISLCDGNPAVLNWWTCSGGGTCQLASDTTTSIHLQLHQQQQNANWVASESSLNSTIPFDYTSPSPQQFLQCVCDAAFANVPPLWLVSANVSIGDCHIHGPARNVLLWIALVSCILGFAYTLIRMAVALPRGSVLCCSSFVAASSLGFRCKPVHRGLVRMSRRNKQWSCGCCDHPSCDKDGNSVERAATEDDDKNRHDNHYHRQDNNNRSSTVQNNKKDVSSTPMLLPAVQQILAARGITIHAGLSLLCLGIYFLFAVCLPLDLIRTFYPTLYGFLWACLGFGICGVAFFAAHISQRQVTVASSRAFRHVSMTSSSSSNAHIPSVLDRVQRCLSIGRHLTLVSWICSCATMLSGISLVAIYSNATMQFNNSPTFIVGNNEDNSTHTDTAGGGGAAATILFQWQLLGVRLFSMGMCIGCCLFGLITVVSASYILHILDMHLKQVSLFTNDTHATKRTVADGDSTSTSSKQQRASNRILAVMIKLRRLRTLVILCLGFSLSLGVILFVLPGVIEYLFPACIINAAILLPLYLSIDSGVPSRPASTSSSLSVSDTNKANHIRRVSSAKQQQQSGSGFRNARSISTDDDNMGKTTVKNQQHSAIIAHSSSSSPRLQPHISSGVLRSGSNNNSQSLSLTRSIDTFLVPVHTAPYRCGPCFLTGPWAFTLYGDSSGSDTGGDMDSRDSTIHSNNRHPSRTRSFELSHSLESGSTILSTGTLPVQSPSLLDLTSPSSISYGTIQPDPSASFSSSSSSTTHSSTRSQSAGVIPDTTSLSANHELLSTTRVSNEHTIASLTRPEKKKTVTGSDAHVASVSTKKGHSSVLQSSVVAEGYTNESTTPNQDECSPDHHHRHIRPLSTMHGRVVVEPMSTMRGRIHAAPLSIVHGRTPIQPMSVFSRRDSFPQQMVSAPSLSSNIGVGEASSSLFASATNENPNHNRVVVEQKKNKKKRKGKVASGNTSHHHRRQHCEHDSNGVLNQNDSHTSAPDVIIDMRKYHDWEGMTNERDQPVHNAFNSELKKVVAAEECITHSEDSLSTTQDRNTLHGILMRASIASQYMSTERHSSAELSMSTSL